MPIQNIYELKSYDENYSYLWITDNSLLKKNTYVLQQAYYAHYLMFKNYDNKTSIHIGPFQKTHIILISNPDNIELISVSAGLNLLCELLLSKNIHYTLKGFATIGGINFRKLYAGIDGEQQLKIDKNYFLNYTLNHSYIDLIPQQTNYSFNTASNTN